MKTSDITIADTCIVAVPHRAKPEVWFFGEPEKITAAEIAYEMGDYENDAGLHDLNCHYILPADADSLRRAVQSRQHGYLSLSCIGGVEIN